MGIIKRQYFSGICHPKIVLSGVNQFFFSPLKMLYVLETAVGYAIFLKTAEDGQAELISTYKFQTQEEALNSLRTISRAEVPENLINFIKTTKLNTKEELSVNDPKMAHKLSELLERKVDSNDENMHRILRSSISQHFNITPKEYTDQLLWVAHKLSSEKVQIAPEKIDALVIQSITLLSDLDKDINLHCMRIREWYGFHFPELDNIFPSNEEYLKAVEIIGKKEYLTEEKKNLLEASFGDKSVQIIKLAENSMGTIMEEADINSIIYDLKSVLNSFEFRAELANYLNLKMQVIAPNLSALVGEYIGAKLISKAGSLEELAKLPSSSIQLMGSENALFQALKNKSPTPKYGIIFGCSLVGAAAPQYKGKIARTLASKICIAAKVDAARDNPTNEFGVSAKEYVEARIKSLEARSTVKRVNKGRSRHIIKPRDHYDESKDTTKRIKLEE